MSILKIDDKWSVVYDPKSNDSPKMWMRHGDRHYPFDESNAVVAMFYALKEAHEAPTQSRAETAAAYERAADLVDDMRRDPQYSGEGCDPIIEAIRALATPDQTAALDKLIAEAEARVWTEAAEIVRNLGKYELATSKAPMGPRTQAFYAAYDAILAAIPKGGV